MYTVKDRFLKYVQIDTQADPDSDTIPSTAKQINLSKVLSEELAAMGIDHELTEQGYIYARIPSNSDKQHVPKIFFCSHIDTAFDCSGTYVKPIVHYDYQGEDIVLPDDPSQVISIERFPELNDKKGEDIITASGLTLLGADDKSGVASIMDAAYQLVNNPGIKQGDIRLFFTVDEEIGQGVKHAEIDKIDADFGYTLDSGKLGSFEFENFSADDFVLKISGVSAHPGYAKGKMENAIKIASEIIARLPKETLTPESTEYKQGFVHPYKLDAKMEEASLHFIIRDFDTDKLTEHIALIEQTAAEVLKDFPYSTFEGIRTEQYRNMKDVIDQHTYIVDYALEAMQNLGIKAHVGPIRGGTDGSLLSHKGLPCPNLFSGQHGIHSKLEWTTVQEMQAAVDTIVEICKITEARS